MVKSDIVTKLESVLLGLRESPDTAKRPNKFRVMYENDVAVLVKALKAANKKIKLLTE